VQFVDDACYQIEKYERNVRQIGVVPYIPRSVIMASIDIPAIGSLWGIQNYVYLNVFIFFSII
jgi:hypothetical protein